MRLLPLRELRATDNLDGEPNCTNGIVNELLLLFLPQTITSIVYVVASSRKKFKSSSDEKFGFAAALSLLNVVLAFWLTSIISGCLSEQRSLSIVANEVL